jgi:hypothetical protein
VASGLSDPVLANLVQQRFVADFQQRGRLFAVPVGFVEGPADGFGLGAILGGSRQGFQASRTVTGVLRSRLEVGSIAIGFRTQFLDSQLLVPKD